jgi:TolB protein
VSIGARLRFQAGAGALALAILSGAALSARRQAKASDLGLFEGSGDVGTVLHPGSVDYDKTQGTYTVTGSGENMWFTSDAYQFAWKKTSGDLALGAEIAFDGKGGNPHRKAVLMIRQTLDADSAYVDIARHGNGMTALQFREEKGGVTSEVQSPNWNPLRLRIEKHGAYFTMWLAGEDGKLQLAGASPRIELREPFYVGIGVCSHDKEVKEKAVFSKVELASMRSEREGKERLYSFLEILPVDSNDRTAVYVSAGRFEAPNWTRDGKELLFNRDGRIMKMPVKGGTPRAIDTGFAAHCNNDHGISPDSTQLAISDQSQNDDRSIVYVLPLEGGTPRRVTRNAPSYWHGWSPDGKTLVFVGERNGDFDIYAIPAVGGEETRLTTAKGLDDGPEYSPDGQFIYFNSERTGHMQIWRMKADGSEQEQVFSDDENNWFPHISPDGKWMVFLTYDRSVTGHPENKDVSLRIMTLADKKIKTLARLFGGQGTLNVPSWSPDSGSIAFVSYTLLPHGVPVR